MKICFEMLRALHRYPLNLKIFYLSVGAAAIGKRASASLILSCLFPSCKMPAAAKRGSARTPRLCALSVLCVRKMSHAEDAENAETQGWR